GSDRLRRDRGEQDPVAVMAACDEEPLPLPDERPVVRRGWPEAGRDLDDLELANGRDGPDRLTEEQFGGSGGRCVVEAGVLDGRADDRLAARTGNDVNLLALDDSRGRQ